MNSSGQRTDRRLTNRYLRQFLQAIEDEAGAYTLRMVLRNAKLERYINELPPSNTDQVVSALDYASLHKSIRTYFGNGARGSLNRIGRLTWDRILKDAS